MRLNELRPGSKVMVALSGGIDSAWALYQTIGTGAEVHAHHVRLLGISGAKHRQPAETLAARGIVETLVASGNPVSFCESSLDMGGIGQTFQSSFAAMPLVGHGARSAGFGAGDLILVGANSSDMDARDHDLLSLHMSWLRYFIVLLDGIFQGMTPPRVGWLEPAPTRRQEVQDMPSELLALTSSCLTPEPYGGGYLPCRECTKCNAVAPHVLTKLDERGRIWNERRTLPSC